MGNIGGLVGIRQNGTNYLVRGDGLGNVVEVRRTNGTVIASYGFGPFGQPLWATNTLNQPIRFATRYRHDASGLIYMHARWYDPATGRWLSRDPIAENGGINLYAYVGNNPVNLVDPLGLRIRLMGTPKQQQYTLRQLSQFMYGKLEIDAAGNLSRQSSDRDCGIEKDVDELIASDKLYRIFDHLYPEGFGRSQTVPTDLGGDIYYDPNVNASYISGFLDVSIITPAAELAHELLGRALQIEHGVPHGQPETQTRNRSNDTAMESANRAFIRMGMKPRTQYK
jgi:RHS repeat-associated protein